MAVGRKPNVEGLNLEAAGVAYSPKGGAVDARLHSAHKRIFAIGDVAGGRQFTHVAGYHAGVVGIWVSVDGAAKACHGPRL